MFSLYEHFRCYYCFTILYIIFRQGVFAEVEDEVEDEVEFEVELTKT